MDPGYLVCFIVIAILLVALLIKTIQIKDFFESIASSLNRIANIKELEYANTRD